MDLFVTLLEDKGGERRRRIRGKESGRVRQKKRASIWFMIHNVGESRLLCSIHFRTGRPGEVDRKEQRTLLPSAQFRAGREDEAEEVKTEKRKRWR